MFIWIGTNLIYALLYSDVINNDNSNIIVTVTMQLNNLIFETPFSSSHFVAEISSQVAKQREMSLSKLIHNVYILDLCE